MHIYNYVYIYILNLQQALYQKLAFKPQLSNLSSWCFNFQAWLVSCCQGALHRHPTIDRSFRQMCLAVGPNGGGSVPWIRMGGVSTLNGLKALVSWNKTLVTSKLNLGHLPDFFVDPLHIHTQRCILQSECSRYFMDASDQLTLIVSTICAAQHF